MPIPAATSAAPARTCIALVTHFLDPAVRRSFERLVAEAPADHDVYLLYNAAEDDHAPADGFDPDRVVRLERGELLAAPYPGKCTVTSDWLMVSHLDLAFLAFRRRIPDHDYYWFVEYDVHYEGHWQRFFEHFRRSPADLLCTALLPMTQVPHKLKLFTRPSVHGPSPAGWPIEEMIKGFFPIFRISTAAFDAADAAYRAGVGGLYEITLPTIAAQAGLVLEDIGGNGIYVRRENRNRFYFANPPSFTHSPGTFVFRPPFRRILPRRDTLWHPVKPNSAPAWFPTGPTGGGLKRIVEMAKPLLWAIVIRAWFLLRWNPLPKEEEVQAR